MKTTMPKYITAPNGEKLLVYKDKSSASGYSAVPVKKSNYATTKFKTMPLSLDRHDSAFKMTASKAAAFKEYKASTSKSSSKSRTASKTSRKK